jgi:hypothetical protein
LERYGQFFYSEVVWKDSMISGIAGKGIDTRVYDIHEGYKDEYRLDK